MTGGCRILKQSLENRNACVNSELAPAPCDPFGAGWILRLRVAKPALSPLMDAAAYEKFVQEQGH